MDWMGRDEWDGMGCDGMDGWDGMDEWDGMGWDGMGWDGWIYEWGEGEQYSRDQMIPCCKSVISTHWLLTDIQSPPLRLLHYVKVDERYGGTSQ